MNGVKSARVRRLRTAWRQPPAPGHDQLTHAAEPRSNTAVCGARVSAVGTPWPAEDRLVSLSRCPMCARILDLDATHAGTRMS